MAYTQNCNFRLNDDSVIKGKQVYAAFCFVVLTLLAALRAKSVGVDTAAYSRIFTNIISYDSLWYALTHNPVSAPVYIIFCRLLSYISHDVQTLTIFSAIFINICLLSFIKKTSDDYAVSYISWIGLTLLYCSLNGTRQCMALTLAMNAVVILSENMKSFKGWILWVLAIGIHITTLFTAPIFISIWAAKKFKNKTMLFAVSLIVGAVVAFTYKGIVMLLIRFVPKYAMYTSGASAFNIFKGNGGGRIVVLYLFLLGVIYLFVKSDVSEGFSYLVMPALAFGMAFGIINCQNELVNRMLWYYLALFLPFIPSFTKNTKIIKFGILGVLLLYSLISLMENQNGVVPYVAFWNYV